MELYTKHGNMSIKLLLFVFWKIDAFYSQKRLTCAELYGIVCVAKKVIRNKGCEIMRKKLLTNGNVFKRTDGRWGGVVWYMDEQGERKRKSFSGTTKQEVNKKITNYIAEFEKAIEDNLKTEKIQYILKKVIKTQYPISKNDMHKQR